jgi:DNA-binding NarL/FixJ family response regulator
MIVEDHPVFRAGLSMIIASEKDMLLVAQATNGEEAIVEFRIHRPDITLMDLRLPKSNGMNALLAIREQNPMAQVIMLTTFDGDVEIHRTLRAGAAAYILKSTSGDEIATIIRNVHAGRRHIPSDVATILAEHVADDKLTTREGEVLKLIREGYRNREIAKRLFISQATVNFHVKHLMDKLRANDRAHAVAIAFRRGLLEI